MRIDSVELSALFNAPASHSQTGRSGPHGPTLMPEVVGVVQRPIGSWGRSDARSLYRVAVPDLILLNGPPASGKSTIATLLVAARPLALNLDVDAVRGALGAWIELPLESGLAARRLAIAMATTHLVNGHDVIVPQLLARDTFVLELEAAAKQTAARFIEIALIVDRAETVRAFESRSASPRASSTGTRNDSSSAPAELTGSERPTTCSWSSSTRDRTFAESRSSVVTSSRRSASSKPLSLSFRSS